MSWSFSSRLLSMRPIYRTSFASGERPPQSHHVVYACSPGYKHIQSLKQDKNPRQTQVVLAGLRPLKAVMIRVSYHYRHTAGLARDESKAKNSPNKPFEPSVIDLFEAVVSFIVAPINEDRSMVYTRAIVPPPFKAGMCVR